MENFVVALDGPAGSGKSSISKMVADRLGFIHIDTGAMYRAVTLEALRRNIQIDREEEYSFLKDTSIVYENGNIYLNGENVNEEIRSEEVTNHVSTSCKFKTVRDQMVRYQRKSASLGKILMDGRDIGTVVLPNADLKIFLTASPEVRAKRRFEELSEKHIDVTYDVILEEIKMRDYKDSHREIAPLQQAKDAILIDTSNLTKEEVRDRIVNLINERLKKMENFTMEDLDLSQARLKVGDVVDGVVVQIEDNVIYLDIKSFTEGEMYLDHYTRDPEVTTFKGLVHIDDVIRCEVSKIQEEKIYLSRLNQLSYEAFQKVLQAKENNEKIEVVVRKEVPTKGYQVEYSGNRLFMPLSQSPKEVKINQKLVVAILETEEKRKTAIVSRKAVEQEELQKLKDEELEKISVGDVVSGEVVKIEKFGAFLRVGHLQGLLRIGQLSHTYTSDIASVLHVGDSLEVQVISKENGKLQFSRKVLLDTPFNAYIKTVKVGQTVKGKVVNKLPYGLFIELADHVKGLLHSSEYSHNPNDNYNSFVKINDEIECAILAIDPEKERISLSRKALMDNPWERVTAKVGDQVEVTVKTVLESGLNVETLGVDGFIPASEVLTKDQPGNFKEYYNVSDKAMAEIIEIKPSEWRLKLSIRKVKEQEERRSYEKYLNEKDEAITIGDCFKDVLK